jgi:hypothetical protein
LPLSDDLLEELKLSNLTGKKYDADYEFYVSMVDLVCFKENQIETMFNTIEKAQPIQLLSQKTKNWFRSAALNSGYQPVYPASQTVVSDNLEDEPVQKIEKPIPDPSEELPLPDSAISMVSFQQLHEKKLYAIAIVQLKLDNPLTRKFIFRNYQIPYYFRTRPENTAELKVAISNSLESKSGLENDAFLKVLIENLFLKFYNSEEIGRVRVNLADFDIIDAEIAKICQTYLPGLTLDKLENQSLPDGNKEFISIETLVELLMELLAHGKRKWFNMPNFSALPLIFSECPDENGIAIFTHVVRTALRIESSIFAKLPRNLSLPLKSSAEFWGNLFLSQKLTSRFVSVKKASKRKNASLKYPGRPCSKNKDEIFELYKDYYQRQQKENFQMGYETINAITDKAETQLVNYLSSVWRGRKYLRNENALVSLLQDWTQSLRTCYEETKGFQHTDAVVSVLQWRKLMIDVVLHFLDCNAQGYCDYQDVIQVLRCFQVFRTKNLENSLRQFIASLIYPKEECSSNFLDLENATIPISIISQFLCNFLGNECGGQSEFVLIGLKSRDYISRELVKLYSRHLVRRQMIQVFSTLNSEGHFTETRVDNRPLDLKHVFATRIKHDRETTLIIRSQFLAQRQQKRFLSTFPGQVYFYKSMKEIERIFDTASLETRQFMTTAQNDGDSNKEIIGSYLRYAIYLHCECSSNCSRRLLNIELPHLLEFCRTRFHFVFLRNSSTFYKKMKNGFYRHSLHWYSSKDAFEILFDCMDYSATVHSITKYRSVKLEHKGREKATLPNCVLNEDTLCHLYSLCRQQAVLVSMSFENIRVPETNYRCFVLGLFDLLKVGKSLVSANTIANNGLEPAQIPLETVPYYIYSMGFSFADVHSPILAENGLTPLHPKDNGGKFQLRMVAVQKLQETIKENIQKKLPIFDRFVKIPFNSLSRRRYNRERRFLENFLFSDMAAIEKQGTEYLKEILTGISFLGV